MGENIKNAVYKFIESKNDLLRSIGLELWKNPELGLEEKFAHELLTSTLIDQGFKVTKNFIVETGFKAEIQTSNYPHIMLLCEYDALPHIGHACGHNLIAEAGIGAAIGLKYAMENLNVKCKLTVLGTPAEENLGCKINMINAGVLNNVDVAMMVHPREINSFHMPHYSMKDLDVTFLGQSAHSTASPWEGKNALDASVLAYQGIGLFRKQMKPDWHINANIRLDKDSFVGNVPDKVVMEADIRSGNMTDLDEIIRRFKQIVNGAAMMSDCTVTVNEFEGGYASLVSNKAILEIYKANAAQFDDLRFEDVQRSGGSTDMGNVSVVVPSIHPVYYIGCVQGPHTHLFTEYAGTEQAHLLTVTQCKLLAATAIDVACDNAVLERAKEQFEAAKAHKFPGQKYADLYYQ